MKYFVAIRAGSGIEVREYGSRESMIKACQGFRDAGIEILVVWAEPV